LDKPIFITSLLSCFYIPARQSAKSRARLLFASRLKKPGRFQLIGFRPPPSDKGPAYLAQRLCGLPGDTLQIKAGTLYVNGRNADDNLPLTHLFKVNRENLGPVRHNPRLSYTVPPYSDVLYVTLDDHYVQKEALRCERYLLPPGLRDNAVFNTYKQNWNLDNFGPLKVPKDCWFVLDDNRSTAADSRQFGFINSSKFIGTIL
jgi:signal peptidase I